MMPAKFFRHFLALLGPCLCLTLAASWIRPVPAAAWGQVMTVSERVNIRAGRSVESARLGVLAPGEKVRADLEQDGWVAIFDLDAPEASSPRGYCYARLLIPAEDGGFGQLLVVQVPMLNVRAGRGPAFDHRRTLYQGDVVRMDFLQGNWGAVFEPGATQREESRAIGYANVLFFSRPTPAQMEAASHPAAGRTPAPASPAQPATERIPESTPLGSSNMAPTGASGAGRGKPYMVVGKVANIPGQEAKTSALAPGATEAPRAVPVEPPAAVQPRASVAPVQGDWAMSEIPLPRPDEPAEGNGLESMLSESSAAPDSRPSRPGPLLQIAPQGTSPAVYGLTVPQEGTAPGGGPVPVADQVLHGFRYAVLGRQGTESLARTLRVGLYLDVTRLPSADDLADFATSVWRREHQAGKETVLSVYVPGQDLKGLSYIKASFDGDGLVEFWVRQTTLYGTQFN